MAYVFYNPNPAHKMNGDCVIRGISFVTDQNWHDTYFDICLEGAVECDMPSSNSVWASYLASKGFKRSLLPDKCPMCYTVSDFCDDHPEGTFLLGTGSHVVAVCGGNYYDAWGSGNEIPIYYWERKE